MSTMNINFEHIGTQTKVTVLIDGQDVDEMGLMEAAENYAKILDDLPVLTARLAARRKEHIVKAVDRYGVEAVADALKMDPRSIRNKIYAHLGDVRRRGSEQSSLAS